MPSQRQLCQLSVAIWAAGSTAVPIYHRYKKASDPKDCQVILVESFEKGLYETAGLLARLYGVRLADRTWALSKMTKGQCVSFLSRFADAPVFVFIPRVLQSTSRACLHFGGAFPVLV